MEEATARAGCARAFDAGSGQDTEASREREIELHAKIEQRIVERDFFSQEVREISVPDRRIRLDRNHPELSIRWQCVLLSLNRSGIYRTPAPSHDDDLSLMRRIDELFMAWPFLGSRRMAQMLGSDG